MVIVILKTEQTYNFSISLQSKAETLFLPKESSTGPGLKFYKNSTNLYEIHFLIPNYLYFCTSNKRYQRYK
jgi:hypothetical protein